jgi:hypothetical protein
MRTGAPGGASTEGQEEMEDHAEMEEDSTSNVSMLAADGTFIAGQTERLLKRGIPQQRLDSSSLHT